MNNNTAIQVVEGSLLDTVKSNNTSLADAFVSVDVVVIVDESGSMDAHDSRGGKSRYSVACDELARLQKTMPGKIAVIGFSSETQIRIGGVPVYQGSGTDMAKALRYAKQFDVPTMRFFLVSDGCPDSEAATLEVAKTYQSHIETIFVGPENDLEGGRSFLAKLAKLCGGQTMTADRVMELADKVTLMLSSGG